jgi:hypothetical protein
MVEQNGSVAREQLEGAVWHHLRLLGLEFNAHGQKLGRLDGIRLTGMSAAVWQIFHGYWLRSILSRTNLSHHCLSIPIQYSIAEFPSV